MRDRGGRRRVARERASGGPVLLAGLLTVSLVAINLRPAVVAVPPLLPTIQAALHLSSAVAGLLTTVPLLCFGGFAVATPPLGRRAGVEVSIAAGLAVLAAGSLVRLAPGFVPLVIGTLGVGVGAAVGNVLLPALVKRDFPGRVGLLTGTYTMFLTAGAALAAGVAVPLASVLGGWRQSLAAWALPAALAVAVTLAAARRAGAAAGVAGRVGAPRPEAGRRSRRWDAGAGDGSAPVLTGWLLRQRTAWALTVFMGAQSLVYYGVMTWLPTIFEQHGSSAARAGLFLSLASVVGIPFALFAPIVAARLADPWPVVALGSLLTAAGLAGLVAAPGALPLLWAAAFGAGTSGTFGVALTLIGLKSPTSELAAAMSALAQGVGYVLAAAGPSALGLVHDLVGGWAVPVLVAAGVLAVQTAAGLAVARAQPVSLPASSRRPPQPR